LGVTEPIRQTKAQRLEMNEIRFRYIFIKNARQEFAQTYVNNRTVTGLGYVVIIIYLWLVFYQYHGRETRAF